MKKTVFLFFVMILAVKGIFAQDIISVNDLEKNMKNANTVVVFAGKAEDYNKVHITGSVNIPHDDLFTGDPLKSKLKSKDDVAKVFGSKGISNTSVVYVYDEGSAKYAGRLYWVFKYMGVKEVKVLDGNMEAWKAGRKPVTKNPTSVKAATFTPSVNSAIVINTAQVKAAMNNSKAVLLDVREEKEYKGTDDGKLRKGHIPGSVNMEYKKLLNDKNMLKSKADIEKTLSEAGVSADKEVILICSSGTRSGIVYMILTSYLGYKNVKVYDGAFQEYQAEAGNKVVN